MTEKFTFKDAKKGDFNGQMEFRKRPTIVVGMSGGVDSSVSALLLKQQGFRVIGLFMKNWEEEDSEGVCMSSKEYADVTKVCTILDIPHYTVNFTETYKQEVFSHFIDELRLGYTPNPDILCNREIKFKVFLEKALSLGADYLATGHYCQINSNENTLQLERGKDPGKDQSYFLYTLSQKALEKTLFPIGHLEKKEVRALARAHGLPTAEKKDSTGICFIGKRNFQQFISSYIPYNKGNFETPTGKVVGQHAGAAYYTIGQRKGLGIGGEGEAWFVIEKNMQKNVVIVAQGQDHPALYKNALQADTLTWISGAPPSQFPFTCTAKIRYRQMDAPCTITHIEKGVAQVHFAEAQRAVTPRQSIVFYQGAICLGGGMIRP